MTEEKARSRIPTKLRRIVKRELDSHVIAHLDARHFSHIRRVHSALARAKLEPQRGRMPVVEAELPLYSSSCGMLARKGLQEVQRLGWILLVRPLPLLIAQVDVQEKEKDYVVTRVSTGASAFDLRKAVDRARANLKNSQRANSELRALKIPALHVLAVWAHHRKNPKMDYFIPATSNFSGLSRGRLYSCARAELLLKRRATEMILNWYDRVQKETELSRLVGPGRTS